MRTHDTLTSMSPCWADRQHGAGPWRAALPGIADRYAALYETLWRQQHLPAATLELCRLRLAQLHGSDADWHREDVAVPAAQRENLSRWDRSDAFDAAERACLAFSEVYAMDVHAITDAHADAVKAAAGDAALVLLIEALGIFDGAIRLGRLWAGAQPGGAAPGGAPPGGEPA